MREPSSQAAEPGYRQIKIAGMDCGNCALTIEKSIRQLSGIDSVTVSFTTESMEVAGTASLETIEHRLRELGYRIAADARATAAAMPEHRGIAGFTRFLWEQPRLRLALFVTVTVIVAFVSLAGVPPFAGISPLDGIFAAAVLIAGGPVFTKGFRALIFARRITIDLLMAIAAIGALGIGATGEAVTVILLYTLGEALEAYSAERARDSLRSLMALQPQEATVLRRHDGTLEREDRERDPQGGHGADGGAHHRLVTVPVAEVAVGDTVLVRPAQRIPVDGEIIKGRSSINQAPVTGESLPVARTVGDEVMAGTVNGEAALEVRVLRPAADGTIARIGRLVEQAQTRRSPAERFIDRFARWYTPAVVMLAVSIVCVPVLLFGQPLLADVNGARGWLYRGLALLIIACPCALVISIPVTVVSGLTRLANLGVLVKGGAQLDRLADVRIVAFDKTGTLTHGRPQVAAVRGSECDHETDVECRECEEVVAMAASVEHASEHPVAHAIVSAAGARRLGDRVLPAEDVVSHPGRGISGQLTNGQRIVVGSTDLFREQAAGYRALSSHVDRSREAGHTVMYVSRDDKIVGYIGVRDEVREATRAALAELDTFRPPIRTAMLTGDNPEAARRVAENVGGVDELRAELLPAEKLTAIEELSNSNGTIAMVGDGINDAPALARADVGIAMGASGTAQAMETADVVLMQDDLSHVPLALRMARKSRGIVKQNIALSLALKLAFLALAVPGLATLWMAVMADVGATLVVTLNGMRLLRQS